MVRKYYGEFWIMHLKNKVSLREMNRIMIFIDGSNVYHGVQRTFPKEKIDFLKLIDTLTRNRTLVRPYYYGSIDADNEKIASPQNKFYRFLELNGFETCIKPLRYRDGKKQEKGADVSLATEMVAKGLANNYDVAILVSGDDDFCRAVELVKNSGRRVEIAYFGKNIGQRLRRLAVFIDLSVIFPEIKTKV